MNDELREHLEAMEERLLKYLATKEELADVGQAIHALATHIDGRFDEIQPLINSLDGHEKRLRYLENRITELSRD